MQRVVVDFAITFKRCILQDNNFHDNNFIYFLSASVFLQKCLFISSNMQSHNNKKKHVFGLQAILKSRILKSSISV